MHGPSLAPLPTLMTKVTTSICRAFLCAQSSVGNIIIIILLQSSQRHYEVGTVLIFTLRIGKLRPRKVRGLVKATQGVSAKARTRKHSNEGEVLSGGMKGLEMGQFLALVGSQHITYQVKWGEPSLLLNCLTSAW